MGAEMMMEKGVMGGERGKIGEAGCDKDELSVQRELFFKIGRQ